MVKKMVISFSSSFLVALVFLLLNVSNAYWDGFFLLGLLMFMVGGALLLLKQGVFDFFFHSFKKFLKTSYKVENYVSEVNGHHEFTTQSAGNVAFPSVILFTGISTIIIATVFPVYLLY